MKFKLVDVQPNTGAQNLVFRNEDGAEQFSITVNQESDLYGKYSVGDTFTLTGKHTEKDQEANNEPDAARKELEARNDAGDAERNASDPHQVDFTGNKVDPKVQPDNSDAAKLKSKPVDKSTTEKHIDVTVNKKK